VSGPVTPLIATADICDAAAARIAMDSRIRPVWRGARLAGPAFTVRVPAGQFRGVQEAAGRAPAGAIVVIDGAGHVACALWGDKMSKLALDRGIAGLVVDGAVRDVDGIEALAFPVFAAAVAPTPPFRDLEGELGVPIICGGLTVQPGDYVYGDADGVVVVPAVLHDEILERLARTS
jgi:RraA family protein